MKIIRQSIIGIPVIPCLCLFYLCILMTAVSLTSCTEDDPEPVVVTDDKPFYYDRYIDESVRPGDDFFRYACGKKTLTENMADLGGVTLAYEAYSLHLKTQGFSGEQYDEQLKKFWISYAMTAGSLNDERNIERIKWMYLYDNHSAPHNRVNGIVRLFDDWYRLFDVQPGDKLYLAPEDRVRIW